MSSEDKLARRAIALARLEATKARIAAARSSTGGGSGNSGPGSSSGKASSTVPAQTRDAGTARDARKNGRTALLAKPYIDYDMSTFQDTKGGYMIEEKAEAQQQKSWEDSLPAQKPPYDFDDPRAPQCFECNTKELDFRLWYIFKVRVCRECRKANPDKYSLLTKTDCKTDYLLTEPELRDKELMPHMERPNPYKQTFSNMMLFMRFQVEEFAFKKWGGPEGLDAEYERREKLKVTRKRAKFEGKLRELRNKTRAQTVTGAGVSVRAAARHKHIWGDPKQQEDGSHRRFCECGMSIEEIAF